MSYAQMCKAEPKLAVEVQHWLEQAAAADADEEAGFGRDHQGDELPV